MGVDTGVDSQKSPLRVSSPKKVGRLYEAEAGTGQGPL